MKFDKIAVIKTGWCEEYQGELAQGAHANIAANNESHESYNFKIGPDDCFYAYTPPVGENASPPSPKDPSNWLVFLVAKKPKRGGIYLVGWYESATFMKAYLPRPEYSQNPPGLELDVLGGQYSYTLKAPSAYMIPASERSFSFKGSNTKRSPVFYLRGNGAVGGWREDLAKALLKERDAYLQKRPRKPVGANERGGICADAERRKDVEQAAVSAVKKLLSPDYEWVDRQKDNCGFDFLFIHKETREERHIEIKGTQNSVAHFFLSRNEDDKGKIDEAWEIALVTDALTDPKIEFLTYSQMSDTFDWKVVCWHAKRKIN